MKALQLHFGWCVVAVVEQQTARGEFANALEAERESLRTTIEKGGRIADSEMADDEVAGEQAAGGFVKEAAVALGVSGEMQNAQATGTIESLAVREFVVGWDRGVLTENAADAFGESAEPSAAFIGKGSGEMGAVGGMDVDGRAGTDADFAGVLGVVEVTVSE